ncbi:MAG TPA: YfhO family protein [Bryobacteraceae bacterium]
MTHGFFRNRVGVVRALTFPLVLLLIIVAFYWKLAFTYQYDWMWGSDLAQQVLPWFEEEARQLQHGQFPLWDPHSWLGQPLLGQAQPGAAYPLNWLLWLVPRVGGHIRMWALQWYYIAIHYMAALFCFLLCRDLGRSRAASLVAGLAFSLAGYVGWTDWPQMVNGAVWTPLVFLFLLRAARGVRPQASAALCGLCLGMTWLSGHHQVPIFLTLACGGVWLYYCRSWRMARLAVITMAIAPIVGALQILPAQEYGRLALRWVGAAQPAGWKDIIPYYVHQEFSLHPIHLFGILFPGFDTREGSFFGVVAVSLALLGIAVFWKQHAVKILGAIALGGLVYSLGGNSVFQGFVYSVVPWVEKARVPAMAGLLFNAGFATLAAFGVDALRGASSPWSRRINIGIAAFAIVTGVAMAANLLANKLQWNADNRVVMTCLIAMLMAALLYAWRAGNLNQRPAVTLLVCLLLLEAGNQAGYNLADRNDWNRRQYIETVWGNGDLADFLHRQPGPFRVDTRTDGVAPNWGDFYSVDFVRSMTGVTANTFELEWRRAQVRKLLGVKYVLAREPVDGFPHEVFQGRSGIRIYEDPEAFPRAWAVHDVVTIASAGEGRVFMNEHWQDLRSRALMTGARPNLPSCLGDPDNVAITEYAPESVSLKANLGCDGMVVLSDTYYPGWAAKVDGQPVKIHEVDLALRGVLVSRGSHEIEYRYRPRSVLLGAAITLAGLIGVAVIVLLDRRGS